MAWKTWLRKWNQNRMRLLTFRKFKSEWLEQVCFSSFVTHEYSDQIYTNQSEKLTNSHSRIQSHLDKYNRIMGVNERKRSLQDDYSWEVVPGKSTHQERLEKQKKLRQVGEWLTQQIRERNREEVKRKQLDDQFGLQLVRSDRNSQKLEKKKQKMEKQQKAKEYKQVLIQQIWSRTTQQI